MSFLRSYSLILFIVYAVVLRSQTTYTVSGKVIDAVSHQPLAFSAVMLKGTLVSSETNAAGSFSITVTEKNNELIVFSYGYATKEYKVLVNSNDVIIELNPKALNLNEVIVTANRTDTLQGNNHTAYLAFEFYDNFIVALVNKGKPYNMVQVLDESGSIIKEKKAPTGTDEFFKDCLGNIQLLSKDSSYQFYYNYESIVFLKPYPLGIFNLTLRYCQCREGDTYYLKETTYRNLKNTYYLIKKGERYNKKLFAEVNNTEAITVFNNDFDINYFLMQRRMGNSLYATSVDEIKAHIDKFRENLLLSQEYLYKLNPVRSGIIKLDSSLLLIDYTHKFLHSYSFSGDSLRTDAILLKNILPFVVQDNDTKKTYL